jgi:hypothetical protein
MNRISRRMNSRKKEENEDEVNSFKKKEGVFLTNPISNNGV